MNWRGACGEALQALQILKAQEIVDRKFPEFLEICSLQSKICMPFLLVSQALDRIELRRPNGRDHTADDSYQAQNHRGHHQATEIDMQMNVAILQVFAE